MEEVQTIDKKQKFEEFKAELLKWKNEHREEYNRFARCMANGDERQYFKIFKAVAIQSRKTIKALELCWGDDCSEDFEEVNMVFNEEALPKEIVEAFYRQKELPAHIVYDREQKSQSLFSFFRKLFCKRKQTETIEISAPLILSWLFYGKSFEAMVQMTDGLSHNIHADKMDSWKCSFATRSIIKTSTKLGYRTTEDWEKFFAMEKAISSGTVSDWALDAVCNDIASEQADEDISTIQKNDIVKELTVAKEQMEVPSKTPGRQRSRDNALIEYLVCDCKNEVLDIVRQFIIRNNTGNGLAMPYFALQQLNLFSGPLTSTEYSIGLIKQFGDIENLKSESSCRQALGAMSRPQPIVRNKKTITGSLLESDMYATVFEDLKKEIQTVLKSEKHLESEPIT